MRRCRHRNDAFLTRLEKVAFHQLPALLTAQVKIDAAHREEVTRLQARINATDANAHAAIASLSRRTTLAPPNNHSAPTQAAAEQPQMHNASQDAQSTHQYAAQRATIQLLADLDIDRPPTDAVSLKLFNAQLRERMRENPQAYG